MGFGDAVSPEPQVTDFPTLLSSPAPRLRAYPREAVVAEKLHAMVHLGMPNTRMKDFFDIWFLCREFSFDGPVLRQAILSTFDRRRTPIPAEPPTALTTSFASDPTKQTQWKAFLSRSRVSETSVTLPEVIDAIRAFLLPELERAARGSNERSSWSPAGPWRISE